MATQQMSTELRDALKREGMKEDQFDICGAELASKCDVYTVKEFTGYFGAGQQFLVDFWKSKAEWRAKGSILAYLRNALNALVSADKKSKSEKDTLLDSTLDNPIDPQTNKNLTLTWESCYGFRLHPTQEATHQILGTMWRRLQLRQLMADPVRGLHTLESTGGIEPNKKQWMVGDLRLVDPAEDSKNKETSYQVKANPFLFLCALEVMLRTLTKAGSYWVTDPEDNRTPEEVRARPLCLMIDRELIEDHLAQCRAFVIEWTTMRSPPLNGAITSQLSRIDQRMREKWTRLYRENKPEGKTFSRCIRDCIPTADSLWNADLSKEMRGGGGGHNRDIPSRPKKGAGKGGDRAKPRAPPRTPDRRPDKRDNDRRPDKGRDTKKGSGSGTTPGKSIKIKNGKMAKTASKRGTKNFCKFYSDKTCREGDSCKFAHVCSVMETADKVCEGKHPGCEHTGKFVAA